MPSHAFSIFVGVVTTLSPRMCIARTYQHAPRVSELKYYGTPSPPKIDFYYVNRSYCTRTTTIAPNRFRSRPLLGGNRQAIPVYIACSGPHIAQLSSYRFRWRPPTYICVPIRQNRSHVRVSISKIINGVRAAICQTHRVPIAAILCATSLCVINTS